MHEPSTLSVVDNNEWLTKPRLFTRFEHLYKPVGQRWPTTIEQLAELALNAPEVPQKRAVGGWSSGTFEGDHRRNVGSLSLDALILDYEPPKDKDGKPLNPGDSLESIEETWAPFSHLTFSSYSHDPEHNRRYRVVLPVTRLLLPFEYTKLLGWCYERAETPNIDLGAHDPARFWYLPARRPGAASVELTVNLDGRVIDPSKLLAQLQAVEPPPAPRPALVVPRAPDGRNPVYIQAALDGAARVILSAPQGKRSEIMNAEAYKLGGLVGAGAIERATAERLLLDSARAAGWTLPRKTEATMTRGLEAGIARPRIVPGPIHTTPLPADVYELPRPTSGVRLVAVGADGELDDAQVEELAREGLLPEQLADDLDLAMRQAGVLDPEPPPSSGEQAADPSSAGAVPPPPPSGGDDGGGDDGGDEPPVYLPEIEITHQLHLNADDGIAALEACPDLYTRSGSLMQVLPQVDPDGNVVPHLRPLPKPTLREKLCAVAEWRRWNPEANRGEGDWTPCQPTDAILHAIHERGHWPKLRPIVGVASTPFLRPDGTVCDVDGYDPETRYVLQMTEQFPRVPERPTLEDAKVSLARLVDLFCDFPCSPTEQLVPIAMLLSILARPALGGANVPAFLFEANMPGVGKSLMMDAVCEIAFGCISPKSPWDVNEEIEKVLTGMVMQGDTLIAFDNMAPHIPFGGSAVERLLTCAGRYQPRILGKNDRPLLPYRGIVAGSGNNIIVAGDARRRVLLCSQKSDVENPEEREGFKHDLTGGEARRRRAELVTDALIVLRAHAVAGRPGAGVRRLGSFEAWSTMVASALAWVSDLNVIDCLPKADTSSDPELAALATLLEGWHRFDPQGYGMLISAFGDKLYPHREHGEPEEEDDLAGVREALEHLAPSRGPGRVRFDARRLGYKMRAILDRPMSGRVLKYGPKLHNTQTWKVVLTGATPGGGPSTPSRGEVGEAGGDFPPTYPTPPTAVFGSEGGSGGSGGSFSTLTHARAGAHTHASAPPRGGASAVGQLPPLPPSEGNSPDGSRVEVPGGSPGPSPLPPGPVNLTPEQASYDAEVASWRVYMKESGYSREEEEHFILQELGPRP